MIFTKYLMSVVLKNQLVILLVLFLILLSQRFIRVFAAVVDGSIPKFLFFLFFGCSVPEIMKLVLPISLFFSILITFNYLHINNEIIAMYSCGLGNYFITQRVFLLSGVTAFFSTINVMFLSPFCLWYQHQLILKCQGHVGVMQLFSGQFQFLKHVNSVFFFKKVCGEEFQDIFLIRFFPNGDYFIIVADRGYIEKFHDGSQWIILSSGSCYFWNKNNIFYSNFCINHFNQYKFMVSAKKVCYRDDIAVTEMSIYRLWHSSECESRAELHWRFTLIIVIFIMIMIISPLSLRTLNNGFFLNVFPSLFLCLLFFLLQIFLRSNVSKGYVDPVWMWLVNFFYIFIAVILNFWDSIIFRDFCCKLKLIYINWD